jgi:aspartate/methionine/tyrosine aminotransferase
MTKAESRTRLFADSMYRIGVENAFRVGPHIAGLESRGIDVVRLNLGEPDFAIPSFITEEIKRQLDHGNTRYCDPKGLLSLRRAIAVQEGRMRGIDVSPEQVVVFPGGKPSIGLCMHAYCNAGDEVIYPSPGFPIYESFALYLDAAPIPLHLSENKDFAFSPAELARLLTPRTRLIMLNFPSNPTGGIATEDLLGSISEVIRKKCDPNVRIYSDEIYEHILFDGRKHVSIASFPGMAERTVISGGFSKTYSMTGARVGFGVFPTVEEAEAVKNLNIHYFSCIPPFTQEGARIALEHPAANAEITRMRDIFQQRRDGIVKQVDAIEGMRCRTPGGAFYLFPNIAGVCESIGALAAHDALPDEVRRRTSPANLFQMFLLYHHHVATLDRNSFCSIGAEGQHYLRLSIASEMSVLEEGVRRMKAAAADREGFNEFMRTIAREVI